MILSTNEILYQHQILQAHAGTGKTYSIVQIVLRMLRDRGLLLSQIMIVTYTEKAAGELLDRLRKEIREQAFSPNTSEPLRLHLKTCLEQLGEALIGTIHSVCLKLLRQYPFESGIPFATDLVKDEDGIETSLRQVLREQSWLPEAAPEHLFETLVADQGITSQYEKAKSVALELLNEQVEIRPNSLPDAWAHPYPGAKEAAFQARWARSAAMHWRNHKRESGLLSFQDMLSCMFSAVDNLAFRTLLRQQIRVGLIDEFQDTSALQWGIFKKWFLASDDLSHSRETRPILLLVGDPKQSIYAFQGADVHTYLRACEELQQHGAVVTELVHNWRSLPTVIQGYNNILTAFSSQGGWFLNDHPQLRYCAENQAQAPERESSPASPSSPLLAELLANPVRICHIKAKSDAFRRTYAAMCVDWILALKGKTVSLPEGNRWKEHTLDWGDFAVISGSRALATPFQRAMDQAKIPWALYKQEGVFASRMALEVRLVLAGIHAPPSSSGPLGLALATRLLRGNLEQLSVLKTLAEKQRWARLVRYLLVHTGIQSRLLALPEGEREWMDLRQILSHTLDYLVRGQGGIPELIEHLYRLENGDDNVPDDRNLFARATDKGRVQIMTMHASKGLEFPVVFLMESGVNHQKKSMQWIEDGTSCVMPSITDIKVPAKNKDEGLREWANLIGPLKSQAKIVAQQERRRLHYVAMTRPKLALFMGCQEESKVDQLSEALKALPQQLDCVAWDTPEDYPARLEASPTENSPVKASFGFVHSREEIQRLKLAERMRLHTSYSQIYQQTSETMGMDGRLTRSEEPVVTESVLDRVRPDDWLPRGARTGDALHELLEKWLAPNADVTWLTEKDIPSIRISEAHQTLLLHGIEPVLAPKVTILLKRVLCSPIVLPNGKTITLGALPAQDRLPEVEFHWAFDPQGQDLEPDQNPKGWMVGYIDLLFRVDGTWYVLDWKTTSVLDWNPNALQQSMDEHGYSLQARIYGRTVARALPSNEQFGGSVYVYLRAFADEDTASQGVWCGGPDLDDGPVRQTLQKWIEQQTFPGESR